MIICESQFQKNLKIIMINNEKFLSSWYIDFVGMNKSFVKTTLYSLEL